MVISVFSASAVSVDLAIPPFAPPATRLDKFSTGDGLRPWVRRIDAFHELGAATWVILLKTANDHQVIPPWALF
jgi:hypothetical protein